MRLKKIERDLLYILSKDSSLSVSQIAKTLNTSKQVISYNLNKLIKEGIIKWSFPIIDYNLISKIEFRVLMRLTNCNPKIEKELIDFASKFKNVRKIMRVDNYFDIIIYLMEEDISYLYELIVALEEKYGNYILENYVDLIARKEYYAYEFFSEQPRNKNKQSKNPHYHSIVYSKRTVKHSLDEKDFQILNQLEKNSRENFVKMSANIKMDPKTFIYRTKKLEKSEIIKGYSIAINWKKLDKVHYKILIDPYIYNKEDFTKLKELLRKNEYVIFINEVLSRYFLEFDIIAESYAEILLFLDNLRNEFSNLIRNYDVIYIDDEINCN